MRVPLLHLPTASGSLSLVKLLLPLLMMQLWAAQALLLPGNTTREDLEAFGTLCPSVSQPWQVSLFHNLQFQCAGVLVDQNWVLTAAHCWRNKPLRARVGDDHLLLFQSEQLRSTNSPVFHPKYQPCSGPVLPLRSDEHDLMMLKLSSPVVLTSKVHPVQLPFQCAQPRQECQVSGWGTTANRRVKYNRSLSCSRVTLLSQKQCETFYPGVITNNMICAGMDRDQDSCQSDSGGPLVCDNTLHGILSWSIYPCGAATQYPAVYAKICNYTNWIRRVIRSK
ncbi:kallikrein-10 precursor [Rattus norvegicus]|uniref:Kallikrein j n=2 Tax=Rattus norvegicus TaxID=10116 RepID=Q6IE55_RAT|nr:kallikrein-10 precursor [Rattus norvegicus]CAE48393.1 TPA: kallikrein-10 [Rattus norvegicus]SFW93266.1 TPA: kallikrein j [Rattus norvegicus]|eukprot:NP_001004100.1 kallikrein-10 precursor [Rattus norvegicus]